MCLTDQVSGSNSTQGILLSFKITCLKTEKGTEGVGEGKRKEKEGMKEERGRKKTNRKK